MFQKINPKQSFPKLEKEILKFWEKNKIFEKSVKGRSKKKRYVFYDGPPFATGLPHYGHIIASVMKDIIPRYQTMRGFRVERKWGWDCHGLPIENLVEKEKGIKNKKEIEADIAGFNQACRESVLRYRDYWQKFIPRIGRWVDMQNDYRTMDPEYTESIWWVFKTLYDKGLIYQGYKPMHLCPRCETTLSNFEVTLGYKEVDDLSVMVKFKAEYSQKLKQTMPNLGEDANVYFLAWTTTPWTLSGNTALAVNAELDYLVCSASEKTNKIYYILAKERKDSIFDSEEVKTVSIIKGKDLEGLKYQPLFAPDKELWQSQSLKAKQENAFKIYTADFVNLDEGTGIVHIAPAFGEEDYKLSQKHNLPCLRTVKEDGTFISGLWKGEKVKPETDPRATDKKIVQYLKNKNLLFKQAVIHHSYPHCWRCDTPLLNYTARSWFVKVESIKKNLLENNQKVSWMPHHLKKGRFGKWLENARDWAISRARYWGAPLPVWTCKKCSKIKVIGSIADLKKQSIKKLDLKKGTRQIDLHRPFIDQIELKCECGGIMQRVEEVFDCWFESGSMPYAEKHYMGKALKDFDPKKKVGFPADFIAEGIDQTRGWFYTLHVLASALFNSPAYKQVLVNGIVLAEDGKKMSKRLKNYPDPLKIVEKYGADALRLYLCSSPGVVGRNLCFSEKDLEGILKKIILHFWNVFSFFITYANIDQWRPNNTEDKSLLMEKNLLDRWILSRLNSLILKQKKFFQEFNLMKAVAEFDHFIDQLSNWYVRRSRRRFWKSENDQDKARAYQVLYIVLLHLAKMMAPFTPFLSEYVYQILTQDCPKIKESVHLCNYPAAKQKLIDKKLNQKMGLVLKIVQLAHQARNKSGVSLRQPLEELLVNLGKDIVLGQEFIQLIQDEANVEKVVFLKKLDQDLIQTEVKLNLEKLGRKYKAETKKILNLVREGKYTFEKDKKLKIGKFVLERDEFILAYQALQTKKWQIAFEKDVVILLKTALTASLKKAFAKRELVRKIQAERKRRGFKVESRIIIYARVDQQWRDLLGDKYVQKEILCKKLNFVEEFDKYKEANKLFLDKNNWVYLEELKKM